MNCSAAQRRLNDMKRSSSSEPDLVSGDGVYSRYLTTYPGVGTYSVAIIASDNQVSS